MREHLLEAAARVFARKGYAGASVDDIAEEAGFTAGALYSSFGSKENLFWLPSSATATRTSPRSRPSWERWHAPGAVGGLQRAVRGADR